MASPLEVMDGIFLSSWQSQAEFVGQVLCLDLAVPLLALNFWRFCCATVSMGGKRLSSSGEVRAAESSCATAMINASLNAIRTLI